MHVSLNISDLNLRIIRKEQEQFVGAIVIGGQLT